MWNWTVHMGTTPTAAGLGITGVQNGHSSREIGGWLVLNLLSTEATSCKPQRCATLLVPLSGLSVVLATKQQAQLCKSA